MSKCSVSCATCGADADLLHHANARLSHVHSSSPPVSWALDQIMTLRSEIRETSPALHQQAMKHTGTSALLTMVTERPTGLGLMLIPPLFYNLEC